MIDVDALFHALTGLPWYDKPEAFLPVVLDVREFLIEQWIRSEGEKPFYNAWVIMGGADPGLREELAERVNGPVYVLEVSSNECMRRIARDPRRSKKRVLWQHYVSRWWKDYQRRDGDHVLKG